MKLSFFGRRSVRLADWYPGNVLIMSKIAEQMSILVPLFCPLVPVALLVAGRLGAALLLFGRV